MKNSPLKKSSHSIFVTAFILIFIAELGDKDAIVSCRIECNASAVRGIYRRDVGFADNHCIGCCRRSLAAQICSTYDLASC